MATNWEVAKRETMCESVTGLFEAYDVPISEVSTQEADTASHNMVSMIGFTSPNLRGSISIFTHASVVRATAPGLAGHTAVRDWLAELANQLLGRFKNRMLRYDIVLDMSTPVVVSGQTTLQLLRKANSSTCAHFKTAAGTIAVHMASEIDEDFEICESAASVDSDVMSEGELMLF